MCGGPSLRVAMGAKHAPDSAKAQCSGEEPQSLSRCHAGCGRVHSTRPARAPHTRCAGGGFASSCSALQPDTAQAAFARPGFQISPVGLVPTRCLRWRSGWRRACAPTGRPILLRCLATPCGSASNPAPNRLAKKAALRRPNRLHRPPDEPGGARGDRPHLSLATGQLASTSASVRSSKNGAGSRRSQPPRAASERSAVDNEEGRLGDAAREQPGRMEPARVRTGVWEGRNHSGPVADGGARCGCQAPVRFQAPRCAVFARSPA